MNSAPDTKRTTIPLACTLTADEARDQTLEWVDVRASATKITAVDGGVRMTLPDSMVDAVEELARRERACCAFLDIGTSLLGDTMVLEILTNDPEALPVIHEVAGITS